MPSRKTMRGGEITVLHQADCEAYYSGEQSCSCKVAQSVDACWGCGKVVAKGERVCSQECADSVAELGER